MHIFQGKKKKATQVDLLPNVCTELDPVKTSLFDLPALHPALRHSIEDLHAVDRSWTSKFQR